MASAYRKEEKRHIVSKVIIFYGLYLSCNTHWTLSFQRQINEVFWHSNPPHCIEENPVTYFKSPIYRKAKLKRKVKKTTIVMK